MKIIIPCIAAIFSHYLSKKWSMLCKILVGKVSLCHKDVRQVTRTPNICINEAASTDIDTGYTVIKRIRKNSLYGPWVVQRPLARSGRCICGIFFTVLLLAWFYEKGRGIRVNEKEFLNMLEKAAAVKALGLSY